MERDDVVLVTYAVEKETVAGWEQTHWDEELTAQRALDAMNGLLDDPAVVAARFTMRRM